MTMRAYLSALRNSIYCPQERRVRLYSFVKRVAHIQSREPILLFRETLFSIWSVRHYHSSLVLDFAGKTARKQNKGQSRGKSENETEEKISVSSSETSRILHDPNLEEVNRSYDLARKSFIKEPLYVESEINTVCALKRDLIEKYYPEGIAGNMNTDADIISKGEAMGILIRRKTIEIISLLERERKNHFLFDNDEMKNYLLLRGVSGCGKSVILNQTVHWARKNGWIVVFIPSVRKLVNGGSYIVESKRDPGFFDQPTVASLFASNLLKAHKAQLSKIPLKLPFILESFNRTSSSSLADLLQHAVSSLETSCDSIHYFRMELSLVSEFPVLIVMDEINEFFNSSVFLNPKYTKKYFIDQLPTKKLTLAKCFANYKDHSLSNGTVVAAVSNTLSMKSFLKEEANNTEANSYIIPTYTKEEHAACLDYYVKSGFVRGEEEGSLRGGTRNFIYYLCQGIARDLFNYCKAC